MQSRADNASDNLATTERQNIPVNQLTERERVYAYWMAGFIEDAVTLHLSEKPMYKPVIKSMRKLPGVENVLDKETKKWLNQRNQMNK